MKFCHTSHILCHFYLTWHKYVPCNHIVNVSISYLSINIWAPGTPINFWAGSFCNGLVNHSMQALEHAIVIHTMHRGLLVTHGVVCFHTQPAPSYGHRLRSITVNQTVSASPQLAYWCMSRAYVGQKVQSRWWTWHKATRQERLKLQTVLICNVQIYSEPPLEYIFLYFTLKMQVLVVLVWPHFCGSSTL